MMHTPLVMFKGYYSGILESDVHYIGLETDFSNLEAVMSAVQDLPRLQRIAEQAFSHLITSGRFSYRAFAQNVFALIEDVRSHSPVISVKDVGANEVSVLPPPFLRERPTDEPPRAIHLRRTAEPYRVYGFSKESTSLQQVFDQFCETATLELQRFQRLASEMTGPSAVALPADLMDALAGFGQSVEQERQRTHSLRNRSTPLINLRPEALAGAADEAAAIALHAARDVQEYGASIERLQAEYQGVSRKLTQEFERRRILSLADVYEQEAERLSLAAAAISIEPAMVGFESAGAFAEALPRRT